MGQYWLSKTKPKMLSKSCYRILKKIIEWNFLLTCLMPPESCNLTMAKATGYFFTVGTLFQPKRCLLTYRCTCNGSFMELPVPSFVSHSSLFTMKSVNFVVGMWWHPFIAEIVHNFHRGQKFFLNSCLLFRQKYIIGVWCHCFGVVCVGLLVKPLFGDNVFHQCLHVSLVPHAFCHY